MTFGESRHSKARARELDFRMSEFFKSQGLVDHKQKGSGRLSYVRGDSLDRLYKPRDRELWAFCDGSKVAHFFYKNPVGDSHSACANFVSDCVEIADFRDEFCEDCLVLNAIRTYAKP